MKKVGIYWYRGLALAVLFVFAGFSILPIFHALGLRPPELMSDGSLLLAFAFLVLGVASLSVLCLASVTIRSWVIPQQNRLFSFIIPLIVVLGYLALASFMWYALLQSTDL